MSLDRPAAVAATLAWYADHARPLPWRDPEVTPWGVMVSEFMLQQTPVARVLPVWQAWLQRWPTPTDLAAAEPGDAVRAWGRLGYPRRAQRRPVRPRPRLHPALQQSISRPPAIRAGHAP